MSVSRRQESGRIDQSHKDLTWQSRARLLRRDGSILPFKLGTGPLIPFSRDVSQNLRNRHRALSFPRITELEDEHQLEPFRGKEPREVPLQQRGRTFDGPAMCAQIGGLRQDPFRSFPTECTKDISSAYDFCKGIHQS
jgi:hypothetical protein